MPSSGALFGNTVARNQNKNLVEFKAGKMTMKGKMVHPDKRKGLLYVYQSDDSLMHFCWKDRVTGVVEDVSTKQAINAWDKHLRGTGQLRTEEEINFRINFVNQPFSSSVSFLSSIVFKPYQSSRVSQRKKKHYFACLTYS